MGQFIVNIGDKFGMLTIAEINVKGCKCICDCGNETFATRGQLKKGEKHGKTSCGCKRKITLSNRRTHGLGDHRLFRIYHHMKQRCQNHNDDNFANYGGRGISVCGEWGESFENFYIWAINNGYKNDLTLDRINVNGNYEPANCRWATAKMQSNNKRTNLNIEYLGEQLTLKQWSQKLNLDYNLLKKRRRLGWPVENLFMPPRKKVS